MQSPSLRLLLAAPGLLARPGCGPTEHVLSLAHALERTGRFRIDLFFAGGALKHQRCVTLGSKLGRASSDSLTLGLAPWRYLQHLLECRRVARALGAYDVVIERIWGFGGWLARSLAPRPRLVVFEENGPLAHADLAAHRERRLRALYLRASHAHLRRTYSVADRIVVQSPALAELLAREFGVQGERVAIIPNGVDPSIAVARPREELGWSAAEVVLVYAGTLDEAHDLEPLLRAMAAVERADLRLVIHGSGPCEARWRELAGAAVSFLPPVPRDALLGRLLAADVGVAVVYGERAFDHGRFLFSSLGRGVPCRRSVHRRHRGGRVPASTSAWSRQATARQRGRSHCARRVGAVGAAAVPRAHADLGRRCALLPAADRRGASAATRSHRRARQHRDPRWRPAMKVAILAGAARVWPRKPRSGPSRMVEIGGKPILWHIMMHYRHHDHREFVIALGYKGECIKRYMVDRTILSHDLTVDFKRGSVTPHNGTTPHEDWAVELVDTGLSTATGGRIKRLAPHLSRATFMLTWGDGVANVDLRALARFHRAHGKLATVTAVRPPARFGHLELDGDQVAEFSEKPQIGEGWINGAFFVLEPGIFEYIDGDDTQWEREPLERLARDGQRMAFRHQGFWQCMDTLRDRKLLESLWQRGEAPWKVWR
ncbi:MAG: glucose-1-phosphate cytidylyltransferase [Planctomycetota bacterium]